MSKKEQLDDKIFETKMEVFGRQKWRCCYVDEHGFRCQRQATQLAHRLPQDTVHLRKYGETVIHHPENLRGTCPTHNASVQINYRAQPLKAAVLAARIERIIRGEEP